MTIRNFNRIKVSNEHKSLDTFANVGSLFDSALSVKGDLWIDDAYKFKVGDKLLIQDNDITYSNSGNITFDGMTKVDMLTDFYIGNGTQNTTFNNNAINFQTGNITFHDNTSVHFNGMVSVLTPTNESHAVNKKYVDDRSAGLDPKQSVVVATVSELQNVLYNETTKVLSANAAGKLEIDGIQDLKLEDRVLVKNQISSKDQNGIYVIKSLGSTGEAWSLQRADDFNDPAEVSPGCYFFVERGSTLANAGFVMSREYQPEAISGNNTESNYIEFVQFSGAGQISAGFGLLKNGEDLSVNVDDSTIEIVNDQLSVKDSGIVSAKIADSSVTTAKIADLNVTTDKIADLNVTTAKIADLNVTTDKIADNAVNHEKLSAIKFLNVENSNNLNVDKDETKLLVIYSSADFQNVNFDSVNINNIPLGTSMWYYKGDSWVQV